jgi:hypothetical protein
VKFCEFLKLNTLTNVKNCYAVSIIINILLINMNIYIMCTHRDKKVVHLNHA